MNHDETTLTGITSFYQPITVTAGVEKLTATGAAPSETASHSHTAGMSMPGSPAPSTSNPAAPQRTGNALLAGVAAVVGGMVIL